ncbi:hypothetical protein QJS10_CPB22g00048 [Acorus calamus]|uniref:Uncharacterized protein n=1 Tax=Acorus calamus TaxID=4465 RepID=A0AAV9C1A4_ACOCL|nr:hypothetical protein QJS10_CPB22g00048 [Acorus calamus]
MKGPAGRPSGVRSTSRTTPSPMSSTTAPTITAAEDTVACELLMTYRPFVESSVGWFGGREEEEGLQMVGGTEDLFMTSGVAALMTDAFEGDVYFRLRINVKLYECY